MNEKKTILIVDDVELNRKILGLILQDKYHIIEASNGLEAENIVLEKGGEISLILLDIVMPVVDGFTFIENVQRHFEISQIPIIFVTSETYQENILAGIKMGVRDVIAKPFDPMLVSSRVDNLILLTENRAGTAGAAPNRPDRPRPHTVLIVDDVGINRAILQGALADSFDTLEAANGQAALEVLEAHEDEIAVILLDIIMPVMDGTQMMSEALRRNLLHNIPVIAITSEDSPLKLNRLLELGICEVIQKPFTPAVVNTRVSYMAELVWGKD